MYNLSKKSLSRLEGVHPDLVAIVKKAIELTKVDFTVLEGLRTEARQKELYDSGATKTMNSRHLTGHAVDLGAWVAGSIRWDWPLYYSISDAMFAASEELKIPLEWGGNWKTFKDGPHYQLPWNAYGRFR